MSSCFGDCEQRELKDRILELEAKLEGVEKNYHQLLYAVEQKVPDETRHQTALRYIQERERSSGEGANQALEAGSVKEAED